MDVLFSSVFFILLFFCFRNTKRVLLFRKKITDTNQKFLSSHNNCETDVEQQHFLVVSMLKKIINLKFLKKLLEMNSKLEDRLDFIVRMQKFPSVNLKQNMLKYSNKQFPRQKISFKKKLIRNKIAYCEILNIVKIDIAVKFILIKGSIINFVRFLLNK